MKNKTMLNCEIEVDEAKTAQWYASAEDWGCDCEYCTNFLEAARGAALPEKVLQYLSVFHIPPEKATYVCCLNHHKEKPFYLFSYRIAGKILNSSADSVAADARFCHEPYPYGAPNFPEPHFDLEFYAELPWVLDKGGDPVE